MKSIYANKPMITSLGGGQTAHSVNVCFQNGDKTVSLYCDDSTGGMKVLGRCDIELLRGQPGEARDCSGEVFGDMDPIPASLENFEMAMKWLRQTSWGFDTQ